jgi:hypothetical protein
MALLPLVVACLVSAQEPAAVAPDPTPEQLEDAWASFENALPEIQVGIVTAIAARLDSGGNPTLAPLLALRTRALQELDLKPARPREYYDPKVYADREFARGRVRREPADPASLDAAEKRGSYRPWENEPPFAARIRWSFGRDQAEDAGGAPDPLHQLQDFLNGYPPGTDAIVAWLLMKFDFDAKRNAVADHFDHIYCDLNGKAYPEITIYDAFSSGSTLDMPDVDVIAYYRRILKDQSWISPIPPSAQAKLYAKVSDGFLEWFQYRVWIEAAANLYVRPTAPLRETHEGLRGRLVPLFAACEGDVTKIAKRLADSKTRDAFLDAMDEQFAAEPSLARKAAMFEEARAQQHWVVARTTYAVLREHGLLAQ